MLRNAYDGLAGPAWLAIRRGSNRLLLLADQFDVDSDLLQLTLKQFDFYFARTAVALDCVCQCEQNFVETQRVASQQPTLPIRLPARPSLFRQAWEHRYVLALDRKHIARAATLIPDLRVVGFWADFVWPRLLREMASPRQDWPTHSRNILDSAHRRWGNSAVAVVGSGPSSTQYLEDRQRVRFDHVIIANGVALRPEFTETAPGATSWVCAYDPMLFGIDPFAADMRVAIERVVTTTEAYLVTESYLERHIELNYAPAVAPRTVIARSSHIQRLQGGWNVNLAASQAVPECSNVGSTLMLPLAATLGRRIVLYGMDGFRRTPAGVELPHEPGMYAGHRQRITQSDIYRSRSRPDDRAQEADLLDYATDCLVRLMSQGGHRLYVARPSLNKGLAEVPVFPGAFPES